METKNMIGGIVSLAVVVICVAAIMMPVLNDATTTEETFTNEGMFYIASDVSESYTLTFDQTDGLKINDAAVDGVNSATSDMTIFATSNMIGRYVVSSDTLQLKGAGIYKVNITAASLTFNNGSLDGTITISDTEETLTTISYTELYLATDDAEDLVMTNYGETAYMNEDSEIFAMGQTLLSGLNALRTFNIEGTIEGVTVTPLGQASGEEDTDITISNIVINAEAVDGYTDLYKLTSITFDATYSDTTTACTYSAYIVPTEVTSELSQHLGSGEIAIINAIPVLVVVSIVIAAIGLAITTRRD